MQTKCLTFREQKLGKSCLWSHILLPEGKSREESYKEGETKSMRYKKREITKINLFDAILPELRMKKEQPHLSWVHLLKAQLAMYFPAQAKLLGHFCSLHQRLLQRAELVESPSQGSARLTGALCSLLPPPNAMVASSG